MSLGGSVGGPGDKGLKLNLADTFRLAWADPDLRQRLKFVIFVFTIYVVGVHVPVPIPGFSPDDLKQLLQDNPFFGMMNTIGGGAFSRMSIFALGLGPYISASIIMQVLTMGNPKWKKELQEGMSEIFERKNGRSKESKQEQRHLELLERKVGQLTIERDWLEKKAKQLGIDV